MSPFLVGIILLLAGLAGVFWGYRIFRILLPLFGGMAGYLIALALFPNNLVLALIVGFGLALLFILLAYTAWSIWVTFSGVILGGSLGAAIASGLNLWTWLGWIVILGLAVLGGILVWKIRDEVVILLTAITGAAFVATGLRTWFGEGTIRSFIWFVIFIVMAVIGIAWQWRRYRHLNLLGVGGPAETPGATRAAPVVAASAPAAAAPAVAAAPAAPVAAAAVAAGAVAATQAEAEPVAAETAAPVVEAAAPEVEVAPAVAAAALVAAAEAEAPTEEAEVPVAEMAALAEEPAAPEVVLEQPAAEAAVAADMNQLEETLDGTQLAALQEKVEFVQGIGPTYGAKLNEAGIAIVIDLLRRGATRKGRAELVEATGIAAGLIMKWVNAADLLRVKGVGRQFAELLEAAGVDTVPELAQRNPLNLFNKMSEVNAEKKLAGRAPHQSEVESWVSQAKDLPRIIEY